MPITLHLGRPSLLGWSPKPCFTSMYTSIRARPMNCSVLPIQHSSPRPQLRQEDFGQDANAHPTPNLIQPAPAFILNSIQQWSQPPAPTRPVRWEDGGARIIGQQDSRNYPIPYARTLIAHPPTDRASNEARSPADRRPFGVRIAKYIRVASWTICNGTGQPMVALGSGFSFAGLCMFSQPPFLAAPRHTDTVRTVRTSGLPPFRPFQDRRATRGHTHPPKVGPGTTRFALPFGRLTGEPTCARRE